MPVCRGGRLIEVVSCRSFTVICISAVLSGSSLALTIFFSSICKSISSLFRELFRQLQTENGKKYYVNILKAYEGITDLVSSMNGYFSFQVFAVVVSSMGGLFWVNYNIIFIPTKDINGYLYSICAGTHYIFLIVAILLSASSANQAGWMARDALAALPAKFPANRREIKENIRDCCRRKVSLTLWNAYVIDRTLMISLFGSLITYGILVATLGSVQGTN